MPAPWTQTAIKFEAKASQLTPGVALNSSQMASLTTDIADPVVEVRARNYQVDEVAYPDVDAKATKVLIVLNSKGLPITAYPVLP